jgi:hypothetical protein
LKGVNSSRSGLSHSVEIPEEDPDEEEAAALQIYHEWKAARETSGSSLKKESLEFFHQKVEKDLQPVLPSFKEWSDRLVTAHQLPTEWRANCILKAIEDALQAVFSATDVAPPPPASNLRSALLAWGTVVEQHEVQIHSCYSNAMPHMTKNSLPMMCIHLSKFAGFGPCTSRQASYRTHPRPGSTKKGI